MPPPVSGEDRGGGPPVDAIQIMSGEIALRLACTSPKTGTNDATGKGKHMSGQFRPSRRAMLKVGLAGAADRRVARHPALSAAGAERPDQDRHAAGVDRPAGHGRPAAEARRRVLRQAAERQGRHPGTADRAPDRGHGRQSRQLRAQGAGDGRAPATAACSPASRCRRRRWRWCPSSPNGTRSSFRPTTATAG